MSRKRRERYGQWAGCPEGRPRDPERCEESVMPHDRGAIAYQCQRKWTVEKQDGGQWCKQHDPDAVAAKAAAREAAYQARSKEFDRQWDLKVKRAEIIEALLGASDLPDWLAKLVSEYHALEAK